MLHLLQFRNRSDAPDHPLSAVRATGKCFFTNADGATVTPAWVTGCAVLLWQKAVLFVGLFPFSQHLAVSVPWIGRFFQDWDNHGVFLCTVPSIMKSEGNDCYCTGN